jgi:hypothetical protein
VSIFCGHFFASLIFFIILKVNFKDIGLKEDKAETIKWNVGTIFAVASIFAVIVRFLK